MLQHYKQLPVAATYLLLVAAAFGFGEVTWLHILLGCGTLALVDYIVHSTNHPDEWLSIPWATVSWTEGVVIASLTGMLAYGWQLAAVFVMQGLWDNSWHSVEHHRPEGKPITHTDKRWLRWGALAVAMMAVCGLRVVASFRM